MKVGNYHIIWLNESLPCYKVTRQAPMGLRQCLIKPAFPALNSRNKLKNNWDLLKAAYIKASAPGGEPINWWIKSAPLTFVRCLNSVKPIN